MAAEMTTEAIVANLLDIWGIGDDLTDPPGNLGALIMANPWLLVDIADKVGACPNDWRVAEELAFHLLDQRAQA